MKSPHLSLCLRTLQDTDSRHPQQAMRDLGITYQKATPQTLGDCWWFWNCENIPHPLPPFLKRLNINPREAIGYGLSSLDAQEIVDYK